MGENNEEVVGRKERELLRVRAGYIKGRRREVKDLLELNELSEISLMEIISSQ